MDNLLVVAASAVPQSLSDRIWEFLSLAFPTLLAVVGTASVALASIFKFKDKRRTDELAASTTWKNLYDSCQADCADKIKQIAALTIDNDNFRRERDFYARLQMEDKK